MENTGGWGQCGVNIAELKRCIHWGPLRSLMTLMDGWAIWHVWQFQEQEVLPPWLCQWDVWHMFWLYVMMSCVSYFRVKVNNLFRSWNERQKYLRVFSKNQSWSQAEESCPFKHALYNFLDSFHTVKIKMIFQSCK